MKTRGIDMIGLQYTVIAGGFYVNNMHGRRAKSKKINGNGIYSPREYPKKYILPSKIIRKIYRIKKV